MDKIYILQNDTPSHEKGEEFYYNETTKYYCSDKTTKGYQLMFPPHLVEDNPEWFKLKEEKEFTENDLREFVDKYKYEDAKKIDKWISEFLVEKRKQPTH
jgi:hypothetical protein